MSTPAKKSMTHSFNATGNAAAGRVTVAGTGVPLVVVHGFSAEGFLYAQSLSRLVKMGFRVIAIDTALDNGLALWVSGDNLWKGAALNAIQNAELMVREGLLKPKAALAHA